MTGNLILEVGTALVLVSIAALLARKFNFSIIPFLIILGMVVGPHAPTIGIIDLKFIESSEIIEFLGRIGVIFLLFYLGLEFSIGKLIKSGKSIAISGTIYVIMNFILGCLYGYFTGLPVLEMLIIAGMLSVSSTAIVAKVLVDLKRTANPETELILGIIVFDDIFLAIYLSVMSGVLFGGSDSVVGSAISILISITYMMLFFIVARKGNKFISKLLDIESDEVFIIVIFSLLLFIAGFSQSIHVAEGIGALLLGLVLSETDHRQRIEKLVVPFRDFFGAIFFFSFGLSIDPFSLGGALWLALGAVLVTVIGNFISGMISGRLSKLSYRASSNIGLTIVARGEFSIIVANLGLAAGLSSVLKPFTALYVLILAILGPLLARESKAIFKGLDKIFKWSKKQEKSIKLKD